MEASGEKKNTLIPLDISPPFFDIRSKRVQALFITYFKIFQALAVEGDVLLPKPFLDPTSPTPTAPTKSPWTSSFWQTEKTYPRLAISIS
jgi:hypothetical protein